MSLSIVAREERVAAAAAILRLVFLVTLIKDQRAKGNENVKRECTVRPIRTTVDKQADAQRRNHD